MTRSIKTRSTRTRATITRSIRALVIGLAIAGVAQSAAAASPVSIREVAIKQVEVRFGDLNLNKEAGAATLLGRLSKAAREVCDFALLGASNLNPKNNPSYCRRATLQKAVADVNHPVLTALYQNTRGNIRLRLASR